MARLDWDEALGDYAYDDWTTDPILSSAINTFNTSIYSPQGSGDEENPQDPYATYQSELTKYLLGQGYVSLPQNFSPTTLQAAGVKGDEAGSQADYFMQSYFGPGGTFGQYDFGEGNEYGLNNPLAFYKVPDTFDLSKIEQTYAGIPTAIDTAWGPVSSFGDDLSEWFRSYAANWILPGLGAATSGLGTSEGWSPSLSGLLTAGVSAFGDTSGFTSSLGSGLSSFLGDGGGEAIVEAIGEGGEEILNFDNWDDFYSGDIADPIFQGITDYNSPPTGGGYDDLLTQLGGNATSINGATSVLGTTATSSALSRILSDLSNGTSTASMADWLSILGTVGSTALGIAGSSAQTDSLTDLYDKMAAERAPALNAYNTALANPNTWYTSAPAMGAATAASNALSMKGNPADNPTSISQLAANQLGGYMNYLNTLAPAAFGGTSAQALVGSNIAASEGGVYNALGSGLANVTSTIQTAEQQLASLAGLLKTVLNEGKSL